MLLSNELFLALVVLLRHQVRLDRWDMVQLIQLHTVVGDNWSVDDWIAFGMMHITASDTSKAFWLQECCLFVIHRLQMNVSLLASFRRTQFFSNHPAASV